MRRLLFLLLLLGALHASAQAVPFAKGAVSVSPPAGYTHALEDNGETIVLRPLQKDLFELRFTFNAVPERKDHPLLAREFVVDVAKKKGKQPQRFRNGSIGFIERWPETANAQNEQFRNLHGLLTLGRGYVTLILTVPEKNMNLPEIKEFINKGLQQLIESLEARGKP